MSQEPQTTSTMTPSPVELALHYAQFDLLPELQRLFPDIILTCVTERGNIYRVSFSRNGEGVMQRRFLRDHAIKFVEREREREEMLRAFFHGVEMEGHPIEMVTVRRVMDQPEYQSVRLTTAEDEVVLRFPSQWSFGQVRLLPIPDPL